MSMEHPSAWNDVVHAIDHVIASAGSPTHSTNATLLTKIYDRLKADGFLVAAASQAAVEDAAREALASAEARAGAGGCYGATPPFAVYEALFASRLVQTP